MNDLLLRLVLWLCAHTRIAAYASAHPEFTALVQDAAVAHDVPQVLLLAVGLHESGLGSNPRTPFPWGVLRPAQRAYCSAANTRCTNSHLHDQIETSAHVLRVGFVQCGSWQGALRRYYSGACWTRQPYLTRAAARVRTQRRAFRARMRVYNRAVSYSARVWSTAQRFSAHATQLGVPTTWVSLPRQ